MQILCRTHGPEDIVDGCHARFIALEQTKFKLTRTSKKAKQGGVNLELEQMEAT